MPVSIQEIMSLGRSGLNASKSLLGLTSQNVANVGTPGYSRQRMTLVNTQVLGLGVIAGNPEAVRNAFVFKSILNSNGSKGYFDGQLSSLKLAESTLNDLDGSGLGPSLSSFLDALSQVSANPSATAERVQLIQGANGLAAQFHITAQSLADAATGTVNEIKDSASKINTKLKDIAQLNSQIRGLTSTKQNANALIDQRDMLVGELAGLVKIQVINEPDGTMDIFAAGGRPLVEGLKASTLTVSGPDAIGDFNVQIVKPNGVVVDPLQEFGGRLGGLMKAFKEQILPAVNKLDEMAFQLANSFNAQHQVGFGNDGSTGLDFWNPIVSQQGAAFSINVSDNIKLNPDAIAAAATLNEIPGGNDNMLLLKQIQEKPLLADGTSVTATWSSMAQGLGSAIFNANVGSLTEASTQDQLYGLQQAESGVSLDEEMINMTIAQKSLEAASAVIRAADDMFDTILSIVR